MTTQSNSKISWSHLLQRRKNARHESKIWRILDAGGILTEDFYSSPYYEEVDGFVFLRYTDFEDLPGYHRLDSKQTPDFYASSYQGEFEGYVFLHCTDDHYLPGYHRITGNTRRPHHNSVFLEGINPMSRFNGLTTYISSVDIGTVPKYYYDVLGPLGPGYYLDDEDAQESAMRHIFGARKQIDDPFMSCLAAFFALACQWYYYNSKSSKKRRHRQMMREAGMLSKNKRSRREDIPPPAHSSWSQFDWQKEHSEESWFDYVGLPCQAFRDLVELCEPAWRDNPLLSEYGCPRPCDLKKRLIDCAGTVALVLRRLNSFATLSEQAVFFGLTKEEFQRYFDFGCSIAMPILRDHEFSKFLWPIDDPAYLEEMAGLMGYYAPGLFQYGYKPIGWLDGIRLPIANKWSRPGDRKKDQSDEKKRTLRHVQFIFDGSGRCRAAVWNTDGNWHDSRSCVRGKIYERARQIPLPFCLLTDTAYRGGLQLGDYRMVKVLKEGQFYPEGMTEEEATERESLITSARQPSEWSNNQFIQFMKRTRAVLGTDDCYNGYLIELSILLYNFRVHYTDRNQTKRHFKNLLILSKNPALKAQLLDQEDEVMEEEDDEECEERFV